MQQAQIPFLVKELRYHMPQSSDEKNFFLSLKKSKVRLYEKRDAFDQTVSCKLLLAGRAAA